LSAPARSTEHLRWLPAKSSRCATSAASLGRSPKVAAETAAEGKLLTNSSLYFGPRILRAVNSIVCLVVYSAWLFNGLKVCYKNA